MLKTIVFKMMTTIVSSIFNGILLQDILYNGFTMWTTIGMICYSIIIFTIIYSIVVDDLELLK